MLMLIDRPRRKSISKIKQDIRYRNIEFRKVPL